MKAQMFKLSGWVQSTDERYLTYRYMELLKQAGFNVLGRIDHQFAPFGYTILFLLGESHFAIHTFPEENKTYIELTSCVKSYFNAFIKLAKENNLFPCK